MAVVRMMVAVVMVLDVLMVMVMVLMVAVVMMIVLALLMVQEKRRRHGLGQSVLSFCSPLSSSSSSAGFVTADAAEHVPEELPEGHPLACCYR